jgi:ABC-type Co2+ transport system permease subunit
MNITDYLLPTDWIAIGCLLTAIAITFGWLVYSELASKIADRRSALLEEHWATTIREER